MYRKIFNVMLILALTLSVSTSVFAQGSELPTAQEGAKSYIVILANDPIASYEGDVAGLEATKLEAGEKLQPASSAVRAYDNFLESEHVDSLKEAGVSTAAKIHDYTVALNGYSAILTEAQVEEIKAQKDVVLVLEDTMRYKETDSSPGFLGLTRKGGAYDMGYTGEGVVVGIIDTGIWPEHPSFADDGTYPTPKTGPLPCEFGNTAHNPDDAPFTCNNKLIGADQVLDTYRAVIGADPDEFDSARDDDGHGTHTASTAAGNSEIEAWMYGYPIAKISGIAPRAQIIAYKALGNLGGFTSDLAAAIDQAVADGVDVINYSIGGGASLAGGDDIAFLFAADAGVFVATSAGNSGPGPETVGGPGTVPWITTVGASTQKRFYKGIVQLGNRKKYTGASITPTTGLYGWVGLVDGEDAGDDLCGPGNLDPAVVDGNVVLCRRGTYNRADKSLAVLQAGGVGMIMYENSDDNNLFTDSHWVPSVHVDNTPGLAIKAYIATAKRPKVQLTTRNDDYSCYTHAKLDGKASEYFTKKNCGPLTMNWKNAPTMTYFSSRGPNPVAPDIIKPDVTAPGIQILAGNSPFPDPNSTPPGELFQAIAGTSMSSPHVAGIFALLKQAHPEWSAAEAKSALMTTAYQDVLDNDRVSPAGPFEMGAGHVNPGGRWNRRGTIVQPGLVYDAGLFEYAAFTCGMDLGVFTPGSCVFLEGLGIPSEPYNLNLPSIGVGSLAGSQTVVRTVTSVADRKTTFTAEVVAPAGYDVTVTPSSLTLNPGDMATFEVTITNNGGGPIGEWRSGSLTWKGRGYKVYSPIAVKGALFSAPGEISGAGESGAASFDVNFGYSGDYTAAPHGLVAATVTRDTVLQDPDQTFSPSDVGNGANLHEFTLSGAAFFRVALPPESVGNPNVDLDVFVYDPNGNQVASSTNGATDELIEITLPADGVWSVYVHGWQTAGPSVTYDMWTWAVPLTPGGGSLSLDSAPASATVGVAGTIDVSWSGLTSGDLADWYLGAVSHADAGGLIGLTLVNVDNR
jgi:subtilisin family serine protease